MLFVKEIVKYHHQHCLCRIDQLVVYPQTVVGLFGSNGAGKSTFFDIIAGLETPCAGDIYLQQHRITSLPIQKRIKYGLGFLPQDSSIFLDLTVYDNIRAALELQKNITTIDKKIAEIMSYFGLEAIAKTYGKHLSGGERRRTEIARSLATYPAYLLLDEPFAGIDPLTTQQIADNIKYISKNTGVGILITDHNAHATLDICDYAYILHEGQIIAHGAPKTLRELPIVKENYLGN